MERSRIQLQDAEGRYHRACKSCPDEGWKMGMWREVDSLLRGSSPYCEGPEAQCQV